MRKNVTEPVVEECSVEIKENMVFGSLKVIKEVVIEKRAYWKCQCKCGRMKLIKPKDLPYRVNCGLCKTPEVTVDD